MEPVKFRSGECVECVDDRGAAHRLVAGDIYTIMEVMEDGGLRLTEEHANLKGGTGWYPSRFHHAGQKVDAGVCYTSGPEDVYGRSPVETLKLMLPTDSQVRKGLPMCDGLLDYFPAALAEVSKVSKAGNDQHNPGQPMHHARGKSTDHNNCIIRHLADRGGFDTDGQRHSAKLAWRALALLQEELEAAGVAPLARGAKL